jgi:2-polyprenyl-3-methyl-5-hydroxy-6-metoxy-1,4-benzoquinol methylase
VRVEGFDLDESSIELARQNAQDAGLSDRVTFHARDVAEADAGEYDLAVIIEAVHDMTQPAAVLSSVRRVLRPDGVALIADEKAEDTFVAPAGPTERFYYGFSILTCLPAAMTEQPTAAIGTVIRADVMDRLGSEAGFRTVERLDQPELDTLRFYQMTP